jgi:phospholipid/cholesterol/gamma-HCH transport system ATP-binding protein
MSAPSPPPIELKQVRYLTDGRPVLDGVDLTVNRGEVVGVMGRSGTGKTTLLRLVMGLIPATSGQVLVGGTDIGVVPERELERLRLKMGMVFQGAALFDSMTVAENVAFGLVEHRQLRREELAGQVRELLSMVDMVGTESRLPAELSGGMRKRVGIARALALKPEVVLYDEPTAGLDPISAANIDHLVVRLRDQVGVASVVVSHDVASLRRVCDRVVLLHQGRFIAGGAFSELERSSDPAVRQFLSGDSEGPLTEE